MLDHIDVLRVVAMKGRSRPEDIAAACGSSEDEVSDTLCALAEAEAVHEQRGLWKVDDAARAEILAAYAQERAVIGASEVARAYDAFCAFNNLFKEAVTCWQMTDETTLNDHTDAEYDRAVLNRITELDARVREVIGMVAPSLPRFQRYADRFDAALHRIAAGDGQYVASPRVDSYHTVWFELHEDLIQVAGLTRADEAAAGRA